MSIANGTTHYNYPQVQLLDRPTFADFNPAFADIDSKLYSLITGASTDHGTIEALQTALGETNLLLASVKQTADSASGKADTNAENITLLQTGLGNTDRAVATKLDSVAIAEPYDAAAGTYAVGDIVVYNGQRYKCTTAVAVAEPFDADKWTGEDVQTVLDNIEQQIADGVTASNVTLSPITGMSATNVQDGISELKSALPATTCELLVSIPNAQSFNSVALDAGKKFSDYKFVGFVTVNNSNQNMMNGIIPLSLFKLFTDYADNRFAFPLIGSTENLTGQYDDDTHVTARSSLANSSVKVYGINP